MPSPPTPLSLPSSYASLPLRDIKLSHVPASSPTPTRVILVTLNRPAQNNAFTNVMMEEIEQVFALFDVDERVKAIVVTGAGRMFCAGADLEIGFPKGKGKDGVVRRGPGADREKDNDHRDGGGRVSLAIHRCRKPTIMAINGSAVGVGITMALSATIRLATRSAKIGFVFSRRGIIMEAASSYFLPRLIGHSRALHVTTTGLTYPADHPLLRELFSELPPTPEETVKRALEIAQDVADNTSTVSTTLMRDLMYRGPDSAEAAHLLDSRVIYGLFGGRDNEEGIKSFFEKRPPRFEGSIEEDAPAAYPWWEPVDIGSRARADGSLGGKSKL